MSGLGGRSRKVIAARMPLVVDLLATRPDLREVCDLADALDCMARWSA